MKALRLKFTHRAGAALLLACAIFLFLSVTNTGAVNAASPTPTALGADCTTADGQAGIQTGPGCVSKAANPTLTEDNVGFGTVEGSGTCSDILATQVTEGGGVTTVEKRPTVSSNGFVRWLCTQSSSNPNRNAIEVVVEVLANYILALGTFVFVLIMALAFVQIVTAGASPEALKAGKKRLLLAASSIAVIAIGRVILDLIGVTGGNFLGVNVASFNQDTIPQIIRAVYNYLLFIGGSLGVGMIIFGGIKMMTSAGNPQAIQGARKVITFAVIGLLGLASIGIIITIIQRIVTG